MSSFNDEEEGDEEDELSEVDEIDEEDAEDEETVPEWEESPEREEFAEENSELESRGLWQLLKAKAKVKALSAKKDFFIRSLL